MLPALGPLLGCLHPLAQLACLLLLSVGGGSLLLLAALRKRLPWPVAAGYVGLIGGVLWFGSLRHSPLGFAATRLPLVSEFLVRRRNRAPVTILPGGAVSAAAGSPVQIRPALLPGPVDCLWSASGGGALDDPHTCDTVYVASGEANFEILRLRVHSACGLPPAVAQIKFNILP